METMRFPIERNKGKKNDIGLKHLFHQKSSQIHIRYPKQEAIVLNRGATEKIKIKKTIRRRNIREEYKINNENKKWGR